MVAVRTMMGMIWNDGPYDDGLWLFGALVLGWRGGWLPCPALLSAPVALTLALSRRAGEGIPLPPLPSTLGFPLSGDGVEWWFAVRTMMGMIWNDGHDGLWLFGALVLGWRGGWLPCPALLSAPVTLTLALSRRAGEGICSATLSRRGTFVQPVWTGIVGVCRPERSPFGPSDISPASGGNPATRPQPWVPAPVSECGPGFAGMAGRCVVVLVWGVFVFAKVRFASFAVLGPFTNGPYEVRSFAVRIGGCLPCPALLSAPVTLTLALSRRAGEGEP